MDKLIPDNLRSGMLHQKVNLEHAHAFKCEIKSELLFILEKETQLPALHQAIIYAKSVSNSAILILGEGTNVLFTTDYPGLVVLVRLQGLSEIASDDQDVLIRCAAGESWDRLVSYCVDKNWHGLENLSLIPGTVGAAPIQNIGAYGVELASCVDSIEVFDMGTGLTRKLEKSECNFGYRDSLFKTEAGRNLLILFVHLRLSRVYSPIISYSGVSAYLESNCLQHSAQNVRETICSIRKSKLPDWLVLPNCGSFFRNPLVTLSKANELKADYPDLSLFPEFGKGSDSIVKIPAGWLIEKAGWRGYREGDAGVHVQHSLVLVNYGKATGSELLHLAMAIKKSVYEKFQIILEPEVRILPDSPRTTYD